MIDKIADSVEKISGTVGVLKEFKDILSDAASGEDPSSTISKPPSPYKPLKISKEDNDKTLNQIPQPVKVDLKGNIKVNLIPQKTRKAVDE